MCEKATVWDSLREQAKLVRSRLPYLASTGLVINSVLSESFLGDEPILDLGTGSGILPQSCTETPELKQRLISLDVNLNPLKLAQRRNPNSIFLQASGYHLPFADNTFTYATDLDLLNSEIPSIEDMGREIHRVLRCGGKLIHFADTLPILDPLFSEYKAQGLTPLPALDRQDRMALTLVNLTPENFKRKFDKYNLVKAFPTIPRAVIYEYVDMVVQNIHDPQYLFDLFLHLGNQDDAGGDAARKNAAMINLMLKKLSIKQTDPVALDEVCGDYIVHALERAGFQEVQKTYVTRSMTVPIQERKDLFPKGATGNRYITRAGNNFYQTSPGIPKGMAQIESTIQVITASK